MNRSERRRQQRAAIKTATYNMNKEQLEALKTDARLTGIDDAFIMLLAIPLMVLHDKYGFGKKREEQFIDYVLDLYDSYERDYLTIEDMEQVLLEEVDITIKR